MTQDLLETIDGGVATLTMNRPDRRNAMSWEMLDGMIEALPRLAADPDIGVVVVTGAGGAFSAGGDVKAMAEGKEFADPLMENNVASLRSRMEVSRLLHEIPTPTIAAVPGAAAGAGFSIAVACDMRIASESARFTTAFARVGYSGDFGGSYFLTHLVGTAKARELYLTGDMIDAAEALRIGLVNRVVPDDDFAGAVAEFAGRLAAGPRIAYGYMKKNLNAALGATLAEQLDREALHHILCGKTEDHKEATKAFVKKREPVFKGR